MRCGLISLLLTVACIFLGLVNSWAYDWSGWYGPAYSNGSTVGILRLSTNDEPRAYVYAPQITHIYTNFLSPSRGYTNSRTYLDTSLIQIEPVGRTNISTTLYQAYRYSNSTRYDASVVYTNSGNLIQTALTVQARDVWAIDAVRAIRERKAVAATDSPWDAIYADNFYANNRGALDWAKGQIKTLAPYFVDPATMTNRVFADGFTNVPMLTATALAARVGAPSNYFQYTPWVELGGTGSTNVFTRYQTQTFVAVCSGSNPCTNILRDAVGNVYTNIGTNGQIWTIVSTNLAIIEGTNHLAYGWRYIRPMLTNLVFTLGTSIISTNREKRWDYFADTTNFPFFDMYPTNPLTDVMCSYFWASKDRYDSYNTAPTWYWYANAVELYSKNNWTNAPFYASNTVSILNIWNEYADGYRVGSIVHPDASGIVSGAQAMGYVYESRTQAGITNISDPNGWPFSVTSTVGYVLYTNASQLIGGSQEAIGYQFASPGITYLKVTNYDCDASVQLIPSSEPIDVLLFTDVVDEDDWNSELEIQSGQAFFTDASFTVNTIIILDWGTTNGFRYR